jgi:hypothetical protein
VIAKKQKNKSDDGVRVERANTPKKKKKKKKKSSIFFSHGFLYQGREMDHRPRHGGFQSRSTQSAPRSGEWKRGPESERKKERESWNPTSISIEGGASDHLSLFPSTPTFSLLKKNKRTKKKRHHRQQQVAGAGAVAGITALKLQKVKVDSSGVSLGANCYLWDQTGQSNPNQACIYAYTVAGVSAAAALALSILQCFTCNLCGLGDWADALFEGAAAAWWGVAAGVFSRYRSSADAAGVPEGQWRETVVWASVGTCAAFAACGLLSLCKGFLKCCGGGDR